MEVEYELTPADQAALQRYHKKHPLVPRPWWRWLPSVALYAVLLLGLFAYVCLPSSVGVPSVDYFLALVPGVPIGMILALVVMTLHGRILRAINSASREGRNREKAMGWRRVAIDPDGIHVTTAFAYSLHYWEGVDAVGASEDHIFLYIATRNAHVVPRRAFPDDQAFDEFLAAARRYHRLAIVGGGAREDAIPTALPADAPGPSEGIVPKEGRGSSRNLPRPR